MLLRAGQAVPNAPQLPARYNSSFVVAVDVDANSSTCTDANGVKQTCQLVSGTLPSPTWVANTTAGALDHCDNVVSKVRRIPPPNFPSGGERPHMVEKALYAGVKEGLHGERGLKRERERVTTKKCQKIDALREGGRHGFATPRPTLWDSLPEQLWRSDITFGQFKRSLKTFMFG